jgi:hypothetical protein
MKFIIIFYYIFKCVFCLNYLTIEKKNFSSFTILSRRTITLALLVVVLLVLVLVLLVCAA